MKKVIVLGGGLRGCIAAKAAAKAGCQVALVEPRQFLGHELTATGHDWLRNGRTEISLQLGAIKKMIFSQLKTKGVTVLFASHTAGILQGEGKATGVLLANSYGLQTLTADAILDTEGTILTSPNTPSRPAILHYAFTVLQAEPPFFTDFTCPDLGLQNDQVSLHYNARPNSVTVEFSLETELSYELQRTPQRLLPLAQRKAEAIFRSMKEKFPVFAKAGLHQAMTNEVWFTFESDALPSKTTPPAGYYDLSGDLPMELTADYLEDLQESLTAQTKILCANLPEPGFYVTDTLAFADKQIPFTFKNTSEFETISEIWPLRSVNLSAKDLPSRGDPQVLVAGAGTSGLQSALALLENKVSCAIVDPNCMVGGTRNVGGVIGYWHGYQEGRNEEFDGKVQSLSSEISTRTGKFENVAHILLQNEMLQPIESSIFPQTIVCGTQMEENRIQSVLCCDAYGLFTLSARQYIDATGDGSLAVLAGADYECGDPRDRDTQTYSMWGSGIWSASSFLSQRHRGDWDMMDVESYADFLRCVALAHEDNCDLDIVPFLTLRESRRILGDYTLTMRDIWQETCFDDTVAVAFCPFDTHGRGSNLFCSMGLCNTLYGDLRARIPYRSYLVKEKENLLITGKAFSATRDASSVCRMNADLRNAGYAVGLVAAQAILQHSSLRELSLAPVQENLLRQKCLPDWAFQKPDPPDLPELLSLAQKEDHSALRILFLTAKENANALCVAWKKQPEDILLTQLAAWAGEETATKLLAQRTVSLIERTRLVKDTDENGISPYLQACRNFAALLCSPHVTAEEIAPLIPLLDAGGDLEYLPSHKYYKTIYGFERVDGWKVPNFALLYLLADLVERHPDPSLVNLLADLLRKPYLSGYLTVRERSEQAPALCHFMAPVFAAFLEIRLNASAARCGSKSALLRLTDYLEEDRSLLRRFARDELITITGCDLGETPQPWHDYIAQVETFSPVPYEGDVILS